MGPGSASSRNQRGGEKRRLILNPTSGRGNHAKHVRQRAGSCGFTVAETSHAGHAVELAKQSVADGVDLLAVCGGDGTLHEVVQGLVVAEGLESVTLCILPAGTENIVANDLGIPDLAAGFEVADQGETRRLDLGMAGTEPFVMSAIAGLPAEASAAATHELKNRFGTFAFVIAGVQEALTFDALRIEVDAASGDEEFAWTGEALFVLVGNLRHVSRSAGRANAEDGLLEVTIVEQMPTTDVVAEAIEQRLFHQDTPHVIELETSCLNIVGLNGNPVKFSLDGEIRTFEQAGFTLVPRVLRIRVGAAYDPDPGEA